MPNRLDPQNPCIFISVIRPIGQASRAQNLPDYWGLKLLPVIAVAKAIRTKPNAETLTSQSFPLEPSALEPSAFCYTCCLPPPQDSLQQTQLRS